MIYQTKPSDCSARTECVPQTATGSLYGSLVWSPPGTAARHAHTLISSIVGCLTVSYPHHQTSGTYTPTWPVRIISTTNTRLCFWNVWVWGKCMYQALGQSDTSVSIQHWEPCEDMIWFPRLLVCLDTRSLLSHILLHNVQPPYILHTPLPQLFSILQYAICVGLYRV